MVIKTNVLKALMVSQPNIKIGELKQLNDCYIKARDKKRMIKEGEVNERH